MLEKAWGLYGGKWEAEMVLVDTVDKSMITDLAASTASDVQSMRSSAMWVVSPSVSEILLPLRRAL